MRIVRGGVEAAPLGVQTLDPGIQRFGRDPLGERLGAMDLRQIRRDRARLRVGVEAVDEPGLDAGAHVDERQRLHRRVEPGGEAGSVLVRLQLDVGQRVAGGLGFEHTDSLAVYEEQVVGKAVPRSHLELADRHPRPGGEVHRRAILDDPARRFQGGVYVLTGTLFRGGTHAASPSARK